MTERPHTTVNEFLSAFFPDEDETICIRRIEPKGAPKNYVQHNAAITRKGIASDATQRQLSELNKDYGIYFIVNSGGHEDADISRYNAFFVENDEQTVEGQHALLSAAPLQPSIRVETKKSVHAYWLIDGACSEEEWRDIQARLIHHFDGDKRIKNPSRCMRLPGYNHVTFNGEGVHPSYKMVEVVGFDAERRYTVAEMREAFPAPTVEREKPKPQRAAPQSGSGAAHFYTWDELNDELKWRIKCAGRRNVKGNYEMRCPVHNGKGETSLFYNPETGAVACLDGCGHGQLLRAFGLPERPEEVGRGRVLAPPRQDEERRAEDAGEEEDVSEDDSNDADDMDVCMADVDAEEVRWLIEPYIPLGKLTIVEGDPDEGKSFAMLAIAAAITKGEGLPFAELGEPGNVLLLSAEDGHADTIKPRLDSLGADSNRVFALTVPLVLHGEGFAQLESLVKLRGARMVLFDPLFAYVGGKADITQDNKVRAITSRLAAIAERQGCAMVALRHLPKAQQRSAKMAGLSSVAWTASARSVLLFGHYPDDEQARGFVHTKHNLSLKGAAQGYRIEDVDGKPRFRWTGECDLTAEKILYSPNANSAERSELERAEEFLFDTLQGGAVRQKEVERRASRARISKSTMRRAKANIGVESGRSDYKSPWWWKLPESTWPWETPDNQEENSDAQEEWEGNEHLDFHHLTPTESTFNLDAQA